MSITSETLTARRAGIDAVTTNDSTSMRRSTFMLRDGETGRLRTTATQWWTTIRK